MRTLTLLLVGTLLVAPFSHTSAQETTASGNLQTEASWSALKSLIDAANNQSKMAMVLAEAIKSCGSKGMVYGPGVAGADANGCLPQASGADVIVRGKDIDTPLIQADFFPNTGNKSQVYNFPKRFKAGTVPIVVLNRNYTPGGNDTDNFACHVTDKTFRVCGDSREWTGNSGETPDTKLGHKWIAVGVAP